MLVGHFPLRRTDDLSHPYIHNMIRERFFQHVRKTRTCWKWIGKMHRNQDYGVFIAPITCKRVLAHRFSFTFAGNTIPRNHVLHHTCERKDCVRPDHLMPVTQGEHSRIHAIKIAKPKTI